MFLSITLIFYAPFIMLSIFYMHSSLLYNYVIYVPICILFKFYIFLVCIKIMCLTIVVNSVFVVLCLECGYRSSTRRRDPEFGMSEVGVIS